MFGMYRMGPHFGTVANQAPHFSPRLAGDIDRRSKRKSCTTRSAQHASQSLHGLVMRTIQRTKVALTCDKRAGASFCNTINLPMESLPH